MSSEDFTWLESNPDITHVSICLCDINGVLRGKRLPAAQARKVLSGDLKMPISAMTTDIWGEDLHANEHSENSGDGDGICFYNDRGVLPVNWTPNPSALFLAGLNDTDGKPFTGDPRVALENIVRKFNTQGIRPVVATELEFFLYDLGSEDTPSPLRSPVTNKPFNKSDLMSIDQLDQLDVFLADLHKSCEEQNINADTMVCENAPGQYEVNLLHVDNPLRAADDTVLFKHLIRGVARKHGFGATFMAKPYGDHAGNSMHVHFSLIDEDDNNLFNDGTNEGSPMLRHAIGGLLNQLEETSLAFAPHFNSFKRLRPHSLAPTNINWGYENRTGAIRIPDSGPAARRIEHRVAGADANPYIVLTAILGAALEGIEHQTDPGSPVEGWGYTDDSNPRSLPTNWNDSIEMFEKSEFAKEIFAGHLHPTLVTIKRQEAGIFATDITPFEIESYLERV